MPRMTRAARAAREADLDALAATQRRLEDADAAYRLAELARGDADALVQEFARRLAEAAATVAEKAAKRSR